MLIDKSIAIDNELDIDDSLDLTESSSPSSSQSQDLDLDDEIILPKYKFTAYCTSDQCRLVSKRNVDRTDVGVVKHVGKHCDFCPDCGDALFWERKVA